MECDVLQTDAALKLLLMSVSHMCICRCTYISMQSGSLFSLIESVTSGWFVLNPTLSCAFASHFTNTKEGPVLLSYCASGTCVLCHWKHVSNGAVYFMAVIKYNLLFYAA